MNWCFDLTLQSSVPPKTTVPSAASFSCSSSSTSRFLFSGSSCFTNTATDSTHLEAEEEAAKVLVVRRENLGMCHIWQRRKTRKMGTKMPKTDHRLLLLLAAFCLDVSAAAAFVSRAWRRFKEDDEAAAAVPAKRVHGRRGHLRIRGKETAL